MMTRSILAALVLSASLGAAGQDASLQWNIATATLDEQTPLRLDLDLTVSNQFAAAVGALVYEEGGVSPTNGSCVLTPSSTGSFLCTLTLVPGTMSIELFPETLGGAVTFYRPDGSVWDTGILSIIQ